VRVYGVPATRLAEELGRRMVLNVVMVGFFGAITGLVKPEALRNAIADSVPPATKELNLKAFDKGFEFGLRKLERGEEAESAVALENE
jgi:2-oxoglutarate ferredoxin oxidoreductase subunit gamma